MQLGWWSGVSGLAGSSPSGPFQPDKTNRTQTILVTPQGPNLRLAWLDYSFVPDDKIAPVGTDLGGLLSVYALGRRTKILETS